MHPSLARRRSYRGPAFLSFGFRPFFLLAGLWAAFAIPVWLVIYGGGWVPAGFDPLSWHAHEMIFGYLGAVVTGFLLTAIPNWTGRLPVNGPGLGLLALLWIGGRAVPWLPNLGASAAAAIDVAFLAAIALVAWREVLAGRNWRNMPVAGLVTLFAAANVIHHLEGGGVFPAGTGQRLALAVAATLIALIGGRIVPSFTRNWMNQQGLAPLPAEMSAFDKTALAVTLIAAAAWAAAPDSRTAGYALLAAGLALVARMWRWRWYKTLSEALVWIMHAGYAFLGLALFLIGAAILWPGIFPASAGLHALTTGAIGVMTVAVMTRAILGHTGRERLADRLTTVCYVLLILAAVVRIAAPFSGFDYYLLLVVSGSLWSLGFALFVIRYAPLLAR